jgi:hypothetical protein
MDDSNTPNTPVPLEIPAEIRTFLENILLDANISSIDETMHEELINELYARFDSFLTSRIVDSLPPEKVDEFIKMNEENKPEEEVQNYLMSNIPDAEQRFADYFLEFRNRYLGDVLVARNAQDPSDATTTPAADPAEVSETAEHSATPEINSEGTDQH